MNHSPCKQVLRPAEDRDGCHTVRTVRRKTSWLLTVFMALVVTIAPNIAAQTESPWENHPDNTVRFATFNVAMNRDNDGQLLEELQTGSSQQAQKIAEIIQRVRPDVLFICELDRDADKKSLEVFCQQYLEKSWNQQAPIEYPHRFFAQSNTGVDSKVDLDGNGKTGESNDDYGFGQFPGKYAMAVLSRFPIEESKIRTYQKFLWSDMPEALWPINPESGKDYYPESSKQHFRLSSKSHWVVPVKTPVGLIHLVGAHPTPPVFDGPEDRNGRRNHDEIRLLRDMVDPKLGNYLQADSGIKGGLPEESRFVIVGDLNADPQDGDSAQGAIDQLLKYPKLQTAMVPESIGATEASQTQGGINRKHKGDAAQDTSDFNDQSVGNLRLDYVLPSRNLTIRNSGVFWPGTQQPEHQLIEASDHRLVWVDVE